MSFSSNNLDSQPKRLEQIDDRQTLEERLCDLLRTPPPIKFEFLDSKVKLIRPFRPKTKRKFKKEEKV